MLLPHSNLRARFKKPVGFLKVVFVVKLQYLSASLHKKEKIFSWRLWNLFCSQIGSLLSLKPQRARACIQEDKIWRRTDVKND